MEEVVALLDWDMVLRAVLLVGLVASASMLSRGDGREAVPVGSDLDVPYSVANSDLVFVGAVVNYGRVSFVNPFYKQTEAHVNIANVLLGNSSGRIKLILQTRDGLVPKEDGVLKDDGYKEKIPEAGKPFIFFVSTRQGAVIKILPAANDAISNAKKAIDQLHAK